MLDKAEVQKTLAEDEEGMKMKIKLEMWDGEERVEEEEEDRSQQVEV